MTMEVRSTPSTGLNSSTPTLEGLQRGSRGPDVVALQKALNERGAKLEPDGKFGPLTEAALQEFQSKSGCSGGGKVDAGTVDALKKPPAAPTPAAPATTPTPVKESPTPQLQTEARRKTLGGEDLARARLEGVTQAQKKGEQFEVLSEENVKAATTQLENVGEGFSKAKAGLAEKRAVVEGEVKALEQKPQRTVPEDALLQGKKAQVQLLQQAEQHLDDRKAVIGAAITAISDGVATESEANAINTAQGALNKGAEALNVMDQQSTKLVTMAEEAGARVPASATPTPAATTSATTTPATTPAATATTAAPTASDVKQEIAGLRSKMNQQRADLSILKSAPPKDASARPAFDAEVGLKEHELALTQRRIADLGKAEEVLGKGPLSADDTAALATSKQQYEAQTALLNQSKKTFDGVAAIDAEMTKKAGSPAAYVAGKEKAVTDAQAALARAQNRGNPDAIRAASAAASKAVADLNVAKSSRALVDETRKAFKDGQLDAKEAAAITNVNAGLREATATSEAFGARLPELEGKKSFGSDLKDRVFSWFSGTPATVDAVMARGQSI